jgi:periplasmic protein TonB
MSAFTLTFDMNWGIANEDDLRFHRIVRNNLLAAVALGILMPFLPLPVIERPMVEQPEQLAKVIFEQEIVQPPPPPKPVVKEAEPLPQKVEEPKPAPKPIPKKTARIPPKPVEPKLSAREQAQKSGILAMSDALSDLRDNTLARNFSNTNLSQAGGNAAKVERAILTSGTTSGSGGIQTASLSRNTGGGSLAGRSTTVVHSPTGNAGGDRIGGKGKGDKSAGRSIEEIQVVFDRNKGSIYSVYNRALRSNPTLQGKVLLKLTIAPNGKVTQCSVLSSELNDADLAARITSRVKMFNFGAKDVTEVTITYPIDFLPA